MDRPHELVNRYRAYSIGRVEPGQPEVFDWEIGWIGCAATGRIPGRIACPVSELSVGGGRHGGLRLTDARSLVML